MRRVATLNDIDMLNPMWKIHQLLTEQGVDPRRPITHQFDIRNGKHYISNIEDDDTVPTGPVMKNPEHFSWGEGDNH